MACREIQTFPRRPAHQEEVCDRYGVIWRYDELKDTWHSLGTVTAADVVTESAAGLIDPDIYEKLQKLRSYVTANPDQSTLKLAPGTDAYWYYFRSSDKCFKFKPEGESTLRIEVDKARIHRLLVNQLCPGVKGEEGDPGDKGDDGAGGAPEACFFARLFEERLDFALYAPAPLLRAERDLPNDHTPEISVRLHRTRFPIDEDDIESSGQLHKLAVLFNRNAKKELPKFQMVRDELVKQSLGLSARQSYTLNDPLNDDVEILPVADVVIEVSPDGSTPLKITTTKNVTVDKLLTVVEYDSALSIVHGSVFLVNQRWDNIGTGDWCVKARQKGVDGPDGEPGECRIRIKECVVDDTNIVANCPIVNARLDCDAAAIYTTCADLNKEICADRVRLVAGSGAISDGSALKSTFAAVQMTLDDCKYVYRYEVKLEEPEDPQLDLLQWDPQPGCVTKRHFDRHKFSWIPQTVGAACTVPWYSSTGTRTTRYPYGLQTGAEPEEDECCQDNWFYCPNVQEGGCGSSAGDDTGSSGGEGTDDEGEDPNEMIQLWKCDLGAEPDRKCERGLHPRRQLQNGKAWETFDECVENSTCYQLGWFCEDDEADPNFGRCVQGQVPTTDIEQFLAWNTEQDCKEGSGCYAHAWVCFGNTACMKTWVPLEWLDDGRAFPTQQLCLLSCQGRI